MVNVKNFRIGVDAGGYEDGGVENLRCTLSAYLDHTSSMKAGISLQISTGAALFGLLPLDLETLVHLTSVFQHMLNLFLTMLKL